MRLGSRAISKNARPGQFVQILCADTCDPLLPRPFSFLTADSKSFSVLYQVIGKGTHLLSLLKKGEALSITGPFGNGFLSTAGDRPSTFALVGGGVGIPPLFHLAQGLLRQKKIKASQVQVFLGARHKALLLCEKEFKKLGVKLSVATNDGSKGKKGFVTEILEDFLRSADISRTGIYTCGPSPMLKTVCALCEKYGVEGEVSVEEPMACGFGACLGCAIKVKKTGGHRFAIACTEGPVFSAKEILWD